MTTTPPIAPETPPLRPRRSAWFYTLSILSGLGLLVILSGVGLFLYTSTPQFAEIVKQRVVGAVENATGGKVELQGFHWNLLHLAVEVDNLTIHGLEGPGELPYAHLDRLYVRAKVISLLGGKFGLNYLEADRPVFHLIVYSDGSTNQPKPKPQPKEQKSLTDTVFDLQADRAEVNNGLAVLNQRSIPFALTANDLHAVMTYAPATDHYLAEVQVADIAAQRGALPLVRSKLNLQVELSRNTASLRALHFVSGSSQLDGSGAIRNFAQPEWNFSAQGSIDLRELVTLAQIEGVRQGVANLSLDAQGKGGSQFLLKGNAKLNDVAFHTDYLVFDRLTATSHFQITPDEILLPDFAVRPRQGGNVDGSLRFLHWTSSAPSAASPVRQRAAVSSKPRSNAKPSEPPFTAVIRARVRGGRLSTAMQMVAPRSFQDLGFDTSADGSVNVDWTGATADDLTAAARLQLRAPFSLPKGELPVSGIVDAKYFNRGGKVQINRLEAHTPSTTATVTGDLGVYPITRPSLLNVNVTTGNLAEFDHVLTDLGLTMNGKKGVAALPVRLHGTAEFDGTVSQSLIDPDVKGRLSATKFTTVFSMPAATAKPVHGPAPAAPVVSPGAHAGEPIPHESNTRSISWDRLDATGEYSSSLISISQATLVGGGTTIHMQGKLQAHVISPRRSTFDDHSAIDATATIHNASLADMLAISGENIPATGTVNLQAHVGGSLDNLNGGGNVAIQGGDIAGEPYHSVKANLAFSGHAVNLTNLTLLQDGGTIIANGSYDLKSEHFRANLDATNFDLAHIHHVQETKLPLAGALKFDIHASGTLDTPSVLVGLHIADLQFEGKPVGGLEGVAHTQGDMLLFTTRSTLEAAQLQLDGQMVMRDDLETKAKLVISHFDIDPFLKMFSTTNMSARSTIAGTLSLAGPARNPKQFTGEAEINPLSVTFQNITLNSDGPVRASFRDGVVHLTQAHITGPDTNMTVSGDASLLGAKSLNVKANGSINMKLVQTFDPDVTSSGHVDFNVAGTGPVTNPSLTGQIHLTNVAIALNDIPNGLSKLNGTLLFDQDRLQVQDLVGTTGGGQVKIGGFITYLNGIYGNLTATGKDIRIRYSGISATADTTMHLQGSQNNMLLSGNVQITRFSIGPNLDLAVFAGSPVPAPPPNPNSPSNYVRMDIHITSSPQLDFQNSYAQLAGSVDLRIRGTFAQPAVLGRILITEGSANFAGTNYELQHGEIYFTNPVRIEPIIDIDATTRIEEYEVTVGLHGSSNHLTPTFRSDPPLPQADVISLLALGRTQQEQQIYSESAQQAGANPTTDALLGGALNAAVSSGVQKLFSGGSVKIDPTYLGNLGNSSARITVSQNIARNIQLTYATNVNATAEQLIQAQVNITDTVSVLAVRDESNVFSLVLKRHQRFR